MSGGVSRRLVSCTRSVLAATDEDPGDPSTCPVGSASASFVSGPFIGTTDVSSFMLRHGSRAGRPYTLTEGGLIGVVIYSITFIYVYRHGYIGNTLW